MWETICDAWACWSGWKFGPKFYILPLFCNTEYPPPPKMKIVRNLGTLTFQLQNTPPSPRKLKFRQILALWLFSVTEYPPPPGNWNLGRSWHFVIFQLQNTPPPPENWNLGRSWHFDFSVAEYPPPPTKCVLASTPTPHILNLLWIYYHHAKTMPW